MIFKLTSLGENKNKINLRVYMEQVISSIKNFNYIDNPAIQNQFQKMDLKVKQRSSFNPYVVNSYKEVRKRERQEAREARKFMKMIVKKQRST